MPTDDDLRRAREWMDGVCTCHGFRQLRWGCDWCHAELLAEVERLRGKLHDAKMAYADGLEQRRLSALPDTEREVYISEIELEHDRLRAELAEARKDVQRMQRLYDAARAEGKRDG